MSSIDEILLFLSARLNARESLAVAQRLNAQPTAAQSMRKADQQA